MKESLHGEEYVTKHFYEFVIDDVEIDLIGGFAIRKDGVIYDCSLKKENINKYVLFQKERIPLESLNVWKKYYELMNRVDKVKMIEEYLTKKASLNAL
jgi:hypothetical protein